MNTYKIDTFRVDEYAKRRNNLTLKMVTFSIIAQYVFFFLILSLDETLHDIKNVIVLALVLVTVMFGYGYFAYSKVIYQLARRLEVTIDDSSITQRVDTDKQDKSNIFIDIIYDSYNTVIPFENISFVERKNNDLHIFLSIPVVKRRHLIIPGEMDNFERLAGEINEGYERTKSMSKVTP